MKRAMSFGLIGLIWLICGCDRRENTNAKDKKEGPSRYEQAEANLRQECTNMVGFRRILSCGVLRDGHPEITNWVGWAKVEMINKAGGVEAEDIDFKFLGMGGDGPICMRDYRRQDEARKIQLSKDIDTAVRLKAYTPEEGARLKRERALPQ